VLAVKGIDYIQYYWTFWRGAKGLRLGRRWANKLAARYMVTKVAKLFHVAPRKIAKPIIA
jgi:hypothetical protein